MDVDAGLTSLVYKEYGISGEKFNKPVFELGLLVLSSCCDSPARLISIFSNRGSIHFCSLVFNTSYPKFLNLLTGSFCPARRYVLAFVATATRLRSAST